MERYIVYNGDNVVACDSDKNEVIRKAKERCPGVSMVGVLKDLGTGKEKSGFFVGPAPTALGG